MKLFVVGPIDGGDGVYNLLTETGEHLASHLCSNASFAREDLESDRPERQKEWKARFGDYEVLFLDEQTEISLEEIQRRNDEWFLGVSEEDIAQIPVPSVTLSVRYMKLFNKTWIALKAWCKKHLLKDPNLPSDEGSSRGRYFDV